MQLQTQNCNNPAYLWISYWPSKYDLCLKANKGFYGTKWV